MNANDINKILGAVLAALVFAMGLSVLSEIIFDEEPLYDPAYAIAIADEEQTTADEETGETPFALLLASADPAAGESVARVCGACHAFEDGAANGIGPQLHDIVGREVASADGFSYSGALNTYGDGKSWGYEELNSFLENPQGWVPGTIMGYAGVKDPAQRADVIAYLRSVSPDAPPLPEPPAPEEEVAAVDAGETASDAAPESSDAAAAGGGFAAMVASADPAEGRANAAVCLACHAVEQGEPHKLGPNIHGIFGSAVASRDGFQYSDAMTAFASETGEWDVAALNTYLEAPMEVVKGTNMAFAGIKDEAQRASIIAWLHSISPDAGPIAPPAPEPAAVPAASDGAPAAPATTDAAASDATPTDASPAAAADTGETPEGGPNVVVEPAAEADIEIVGPEASNN